MDMLPQTFTAALRGLLAMSKTLPHSRSSLPTVLPSTRCARHHSSCQARDFCFWLAAVLCILRPPEAPCQPTSPKTVLVLNSYRTGYAWTDEQVRGIRSVLSNQSYPIELYLEYMDLA